LNIYQEFLDFVEPSVTAPYKKRIQELEAIISDMEKTMQKGDKVD